MQSSSCTWRSWLVDHYLTGHVYPHGYDWVVQLVFGGCIIASYAYAFSHRPARARRPA